MARSEDADGFYTCERCGKRKPLDFTCSCGGHGGGEPLVPEGWDPELTRSSRRRLSIVRGPDQGSGPQPPRPSQPPERSE